MNRVPDEALCLAARDGDPNAFGTIVQRYQTLLCSLAFSRTGNLAASQDIAQEAFLTAWRSLRELRDPQLLRPWLCGIVRNLAANTVRKSARQAEHVLPEILETVTPEAQAVSREEETLLWSALDGMPPQYRDPLVLFYREDQSIACVALHLDLSEDVVKQRLSRGRAMLRGRMAQLVESTLTRSKPKAAFTASVLAAITLSAPNQASAATVLAGSSVKIAGGTFAPLLGPIAGLSTAWLASVGLEQNAQSDAERQIIRRSFVRAMRFCIPMILAILAIVAVGTGPLRNQPWFLIAAPLLWTIALLTRLIHLGKTLRSEIAELRPPVEPKQIQSKWRILGLPLFAYGSTGLDPGAPDPRAVKAWIAVGDLAISPLFAIGGIAIAPIAIGGITVGLLSLSLAGIAIGGIAVGAIAAGWSAFGMGAIGWKSAAGAAAIARDYAWGSMAQATEANTSAAKAWFASQWFLSPVELFTAAIPWIIGLCIVVPIALLFSKNRPAEARPTSAPRIPALDALRALALLAGVLLHSTLPFLLNPGMWAVGTREPQPFVGWLAYYLHSFRLELFFLLAGYFGYAAVQRRGVATYLRNRVTRLLLVFVLALYPMKFALISLWMIGGKVTGWLPPTNRAWHTLAWNGLFEERWPAIQLTHLWFLYVLFCITALFLALRAFLPAIPMPSRISPLWLIPLLTPLLAAMKGMDIDTPDSSFAWNLPVMALYGIFFAVGWWICANPGTLESLRDHYKRHLLLGLVASLVASTLIVIRYGNGDSGALRLGASLGTAVTMTASTFGWLGAAQSWFAAPSRRMQALANASYWIYVAHLPVVVALQIALAGSGLPWWIQIPVTVVLTVGILMAIKKLWDKLGTLPPISRLYK